MTVLSWWKQSPNLLTGKAVNQVIGIAGLGRLADGNATSAKFRLRLSERARY